MFPQAGPAYALGPPVSVSSGPGRTPSSGAVLTWQLKKAKRRCADGHRGRKARGNRCRRPWSGTVSSSVISAGSWSLMNPSREVIHHHTRPQGSAWRDGEVRRHLAVRGMDPHLGHLRSSRAGSGHVPCCARQVAGEQPVPRRVSVGTRAADRQLPMCDRGPGAGGQSPGPEDLFAVPVGAIGP